MDVNRGTIGSKKVDDKVERGDLRIRSILNEDLRSSTRKDRRQLSFERLNNIKNIIIRKFVRFVIKIEIKVKFTTTGSIFAETIFFTMLTREHKKTITRVFMTPKMIISRANNTDERKVIIKGVKR